VIQKNTILGVLMATLAALSLPACNNTTPTIQASPPPAPPSPPVTVSLIGINDINGNLTPPTGSVTVADPASPSGTRVSAGGLAYMATLVASLKAQNPGGTLVVGAGDLIGASPLNSALQHDEPTIEALNLLGLNVSAVGNHEFDHGLAELKRMQTGGCFAPSADGSRGVVGVDTCLSGGKFAGAAFQYLAANVTETATGQTVFPAYVVRRVAGVDIAFIGLTLKGTPSLVTPASTAGLAFGDEVATVNGLIPELKAKGVSSVVVLLHQGGFTTATTVNDKSCPGLTGDIVALTDQFDPAVDVVISGHTRFEYNCVRPNGRLLTQAGFYGRMVSKIDLVIDPDQRKVLSKSANNVVVVNDVGVKDATGALIALPAGMSALLKDVTLDGLIQRAGALITSLTSQVIGKLESVLTRAVSSAGESQVGDVVADIYLAGSSGAAYGQNAGQIALVNTGGVRADLGSTSVSFANLFTVMPFGNNLVTVSLTGAQIGRLLEQQWESPQPAAGRVMQVSNGFSYTWDNSQPAGAAPGTGARVLAGSMKLNGVTLDPAKSYRVTVNNFMATGGDNFTVLPKSGTGIQEGVVDIDAGVAYFKAQGTVAKPGQNRITRLN
jgi:5'-nucleotidase